MAVEPITWCDAEVFVRQMSAGRTAPVLVRARTDAGEPVECVVKLSSRLTMPPLEYLLEWYGAVIGRELGVNVPAPFAVRITRELAAVIDDAEVARHVGASLGVAYGSKFERGYDQIVSGYTFSPTQREQATRVLLFDVLVHNVDRRRDNANLLVARERFLAFDHEQAFISFLLPILFAPDPVTTPCAEIVEQHVLREVLRSGMDGLKDAVASLARLDDPFFAALEAATPREWTTGHALGKIAVLTQVLRARRDAAAQWTPQVEALVMRNR